MDGKGRALDNIFTERLWRSVKYEEVYLADYGTPRDARHGIAGYFTFYNTERPHQALDYRRPARALSPGVKRFIRVTEAPTRKTGAKVVLDIGSTLLMAVSGGRRCIRQFSIFKK